MAVAKEETLNLEGTQYILRTPRDAHLGRNKTFRVLVSVHGTNGSAQAYMNIPKSHGDDYNFNLIIVTPQFPKEADAPDSNMNGGNFDFVGSGSHQWLHRLLHEELPQRFHHSLSVDTDKVYLFGHSKGGQFVHTYMMNHYSQDVLRAAICGAGFLRGKNHHQFRDMPDEEYDDRLTALVRSHVAFIVGSSDCACGIEGSDHLEVTSGGDAWDDNFCKSGRDKWDRQKEVIKYFNSELLPKLGRAYMRCVISQPPDWHPTGANFPIDETVSVNPQWTRNVRFFWTANRADSSGEPVQGHRGTKNYVTARRYLFEPEPFFCWPAWIEALGSRFASMRPQ